MAFMLIRVGAGLSIDQALHLSVNFDNRMLQPQEAFTFLGNLLEQTFLNTQKLASTSPTAAHLRSRSVLNVFPPPLPAPAPSGDEGSAWSSGGGGQRTRPACNSDWQNHAGRSQLHLGCHGGTQGSCSTRSRSEMLLWKRASSTRTPPPQHQLHLISKTVTGKSSFKEDLFSERSQAQAGLGFPLNRGNLISWRPAKESSLCFKYMLVLKNLNSDWTGCVQGEGGGRASRQIFVNTGNEVCTWVFTFIKMCLCFP